MKEYILLVSQCDPAFKKQIIGVLEGTIKSVKVNQGENQNALGNT